MKPSLRESRGYSLVEMLVVLSILGVVMGSLTTILVTASNAELDMNNRFQAQATARLALDKIRHEVHCASVATPTASTSSVTLTLPSGCKTGSGSITWCTRNVATNRYALYRVVGSSCTGGVKWADQLVPTSTAPICGSALCVFNYTAQSTSSLAKLHLDLPANPNPAKTLYLYELIDDVVLRNSTRT
jgi:prepilin-type N-terminal cleavage/methylation domain-containing protein